MSDNAMELAKAALPGAAQAVGSIINFFFGLAKTAGLSEEQARAELGPTYQRLMARADRVEAVPVFDPDAPRRPAEPYDGRTFENTPPSLPDPDPTAPGGA